jgi:hypothetical protein
VEGEFVLIFPKSFAGSESLPLSTKYCRTDIGPSAVTGQFQSGVPMCTACLNWGGVIWAGVGPGAVVEGRACVSEVEKPERLYRHPVFREKAALGFAVSACCINKALGLLVCASQCVSCV